MAVQPILTGNQWDTGGPIHRTSPFPTDITSVNTSLSAATNYAANDPTAYVGQIVTVVTANGVVSYHITNTAGDLEPIGNTYGVFTSTNAGLVPAGGANTNYVLEASGNWIAIPSGQTYATLDSSNHATNGNYVVHGPGTSTNLYLQGNGSWSSPTNTTYDTLSTSAHATNTTYVIKGPGSNTGAFLQGDGSWATPTNNTYTNGTGLDLSSNTFSLRVAQNTQIGGVCITDKITSEPLFFKQSPSAYYETNPSSTTNKLYNYPMSLQLSKRNVGFTFDNDKAVGSSYHFDDDLDVYYEYRRETSNGTLLYFKNKKGEDLYDLPSNITTSIKIVIKTEYTVGSEVVKIHGFGGDRFLYRNSSQHYMKGITIPSYITLLLTYDSSTGWIRYDGITGVYKSIGLEVGYEDSNRDYTVRGHGYGAAGSNYFLRGDGNWVTVGGGTTYAALDLSHNNTNGEYVVHGAGSTNTTLFLNASGGWSTPAGGGGTTYATLASNNHASGTNYVVNGPGTTTNVYLRGDGRWGTPTNTTYGTFTTAGSGLVPPPSGVTSNTNYVLSGNGLWVPNGGGVITQVKCMGAYHWIGESATFDPSLFVAGLMKPILEDSSTNDCSIVTAEVPVSEGQGGLDGHICGGFLVLMYAAYLASIGSTCGRLVWESPGFGDYYGYMIFAHDTWCCPNGYSSYDILTANGISLLTSNWAGYMPTANGGLPLGMDDYIVSATGISSGPENYNNHKYILNFSGVDGADLAIMQNTVLPAFELIKEKETTETAGIDTILNDLFAKEGGVIPIFKGSGLVVTCEHRSGPQGSFDFFRV